MIRLLVMRYGSVEWRDLNGDGFDSVNHALCAAAHEVEHQTSSPIAVFDGVDPVVFRAPNMSGWTDPNDDEKRGLVKLAKDLAR